MPRGGGPLKEAGTGGDASPHAREPLPLHDSVLWVPRGVSDPVAEIWTDPDSHAVFLQHDVLVGVGRHLAGEETEARFGFLLGHLFRCPETGRAYVVADTAVAAREVLAEEASGAYLIRAWTEAQSVFSGHSGLLLGWYHSHWRLGPVPSEADVETATRYFAAPWQFSIVVVPEEQDPRGGVFHHHPGETRATPRPGPFYELLGAPHGGDLEAADLAIAWSNHEARIPISPPPLERSSAESPPAEPSDAEPSDAEPSDAEPPPAAKGEPAPARMGPWPGNVEGPVSSPREEDRAGDAPETSRRASSTPVQARRDGGRAEPGVARPRTVAHPSPGGHGERPASIPLVIPGEGGQAGLLPPRDRRIGWPAVVAGICVLLIALFFLLSNGGDGPVRTAPPPAARTTPPPGVQRLLEQVEAVEIAGERYAERAADFDAGRIGCDLLATGYVAADEAYVRVATAYRDLGGEPNPRATAAYETAGEEIAAVNNHFDESGCPRP